jgi:hypothetical protein
MSNNYINLGKAVVEIEKQAIEALSAKINADFALACELLLA